MLDGMITRRRRSVKDESRKEHLQKSECGEGGGKRASRHKEQGGFKILRLSNMQEGTGDIGG